MVYCAGCVLPPTAGIKFLAWLQDTAEAARHAFYPLIYVIVSLIMDTSGSAYYSGETLSEHGSTNMSSSRHIHTFHRRPDSHLSTYTVFHGTQCFAGTGRNSPYSSAKLSGVLGASQRSGMPDAPHAPNGFAAVSQKFTGTDGNPAYKYGAFGYGTARAADGSLTGPEASAATMTRTMAVTNASSPYGRGIPMGGLKGYEFAYGGSHLAGSLAHASSTIGSTGKRLAQDGSWHAPAWLSFPIAEAAGKSGPVIVIRLMLTLGPVPTAACVHVDYSGCSTA